MEKIDIRNDNKIYLQILFYFFVLSIAIAPPLYLLLPISSVLRSIRIYELIIFMILIVSFFASLQRDDCLFHKTPINIPMIVFIFLWVVSLLVGAINSNELIIKDYLTILKPVRLLLIVQMMLFCVKKRIQIKYIIFILVLSSLYPALLGVLEYFDSLIVKKFLTHVYPTYEYSPMIAGGFDVFGVGFLHRFRMSSVFVGDVNAFGGYAAILFLMAFIACFFFPKKRYKISFGIICCILMYSVLISGSRKALLCIVLGVGILVLFKLSHIKKMIPILVVSIISFITLLPKSFVERFFDRWEHKFNNIKLLWIQFINLDFSSMLFGTGAVHHFGIDSFHMKLLIRGGVLSFIVYCLLILMILWTAKYVISNSSNWFDEMIGLMAITLTISMEWLNVTGLYTFCARISESYWIIVGALMIVYRFIRIDKNEDKKTVNI